MDIGNLTNEKITKDTVATLQTNFQKYYKIKTENLLKTISSIEGKEQSIFEQIKKLELLKDSSSRYEQKYENTPEYSQEKSLAYAILKNRNKLLDMDNSRILAQEYQKLADQLEKAYRDAYSLINEFRAEFFKEITYIFAFKDSGKIFEAHITEKELLPLLQLSVNSKTKELEKSFKLKINTSKVFLNDLIIKIQNNQKTYQEDNKYLTLLEELNTNNKLFSLFMEYKQGNKGQRYEAYRALLAEFNGDIAAIYTKYSKKGSLKRRITQEITKAKKNNISWTRGGDVGSVQIKYMDASVTTGVSLVNTLRSMLEILNMDYSKEKETIAKEIAKLFGEGTNFDKIKLTSSEQKALKEIQNEVLKKL